MPNGTYGGVRGRKTKEVGGKLRKSFVFLLLDFFTRAFPFVFVVLIFYIYQSICITSRYCRWPDFAVVSKKGRELEFPCIGDYSSQRGVRGI